MSDPFIGEIKMFGGNFAPRGWAFCDGQLLAITQNEALFSLLGTIYGGDGRTTFGLPDLRGRAPMHQTNAFGLTPRPIGTKGGAENVTVTVAQLPSHSHIDKAPQATGNPADTSEPAGNSLAMANIYSSEAPNAEMSSDSIPFGGSPGATGGSLEHTNMPPFQVINFIIAIYGVYPSRS